MSFTSEHSTRPIRRRSFSGRSRRIHRPLDWNEREFIAWDGEGLEVPINKTLKLFSSVHMNPRLPDGTRQKATVFQWDCWFHDAPKAQPYVLLANSKGDSIVQKEGLPTTDCLEHILQCRQQYPNAINVGFGFTYDVAQILKDLSVAALWRLWRTNTVRYNGYRIEYRPKRWIKIGHPATKRGATIFDTIGFFQSSFLTACEKYLGRDDPDMRLIEKGKAARAVFKWEELEEFIKPYNAAELRMLVNMMNILRNDLHDAGLQLAQWYGPGAVANQLLKKHNIEAHKSKELSEEVNGAAQYAYAGGRFEQFKLGRHEGTVYEYDIRSAYPAAIVNLPSLSEGYWEFTEAFEPESFGVWNTSYNSPWEDDRPEPLFCRSKNGSISFPRKVEGWYWTPEACLVPNHIRGGYVWRTSRTDRPFSFVAEMYSQRAYYKSQGISTERALKLALNSIYGKLAQLIGGRDGPPKWHQLEWAGYITSYTRAKIYKAILLNPFAIIAAETDAIFSTEPLDLTLSEELGDWELTTFKEILYLQSGFYYAKLDDEEIICRYRGLDRNRNTKQPDGLPYRTVVDHLYKYSTPEHGRIPPLRSTTTRFVNIGLALSTRKEFRSWEKETKNILIGSGGGQSKRYHMRCDACREGYTLADSLHPQKIGGYSGPSYPHSLPWLPSWSDEYDKFLELNRVDWWQ